MESQTMAEHRNCTVEDDQVKMCDALKRSVQEAGKGITIFESYNFKLGRVARTAAILKSGEWSRKGIVVNYCPFCGASIGEHMGKPKENA